MAGLPDLIALLYRADWTRLSLSAELRADYGPEPPPPAPPIPVQPRKFRSRWYRDWPGQRQDNGRYVGHGALLIGPGGRWRLVCPDPGRGAGGEAAEGNDGEHVWSWRPLELGGPAPLPAKENGAYLPVPELLCPSLLLGGYTLEELGPVTVAGRDAIAVAATPRRDALGSGYRVAGQAYDRVEVAVDAELGILLRRTETSGGELVSLTELTDVTMNPPEAADPARFTPRAGSHLGDADGEKPAVSGPGWAAFNLAAGGLDALTRHLPNRPGRAEPAGPPETFPSPDPAPLEPGDGAPPPGEVLELLYRSGEPRVLSGTARQWLDFAAVTRQTTEEIRAEGGGFATLLDTFTNALTVTRTEARLRVSGPDRYRLDYSARPRPADATTVSCDGERSWRVLADRTLVGPAAPLREPMAALAESSWLLRLRLSGGAELTYRGRPARQIRVTSSGGGAAAPGLLMTYPADAIVDAETGCLLRLLCYAEGNLAIWSELDGISTEPIDPDEFRVDVPPGTRVVEQTGNLITDAVAGIPGVKGTAARAAAEAVNRTVGAVSAARSFLDDLRGHR